MRRRYRYLNGVLVEVPWSAKSSSAAPFVWDDLPAYESPIDGKPVEGRRQRRNDLARSGSRPYEGREQEAKEAAKVQAAREGKLDQLADRMAHRMWAEAPESTRKLFRSK
jgi:hypothetical protein